MEPIIKLTIHPVIKMFDIGDAVETCRCMAYGSICRGGHHERKQISKFVLILMPGHTEEFVMQIQRFWCRSAAGTEDRPPANDSS